VKQEKKYIKKMESKRRRNSYIHIGQSRYQVKICRKDNEGHYIQIKGTIREQDMKIMNIYAMNVDAPSFIIQLVLGIKGQIGSNTIVTGNVNNPLSSADHLSPK
jgi:hypothetical protein